MNEVRRTWLYPANNMEDAKSQASQDMETNVT